VETGWGGGGRWRLTKASWSSGSSSVGLNRPSMEVGRCSSLGWRSGALGKATVVGRGSVRAIRWCIGRGGNALGKADEAAALQE
jgi:hypothetical protein